MVAVFGTQTTDCRVVFAKCARLLSLSVLGGKLNRYASDCGLVGHPELGQCGGNAIHITGAALQVACTLNSSSSACTSQCPLEEWVARGHDVGTTLSDLPSDSEIIAAGRQLLGLSQ